MADNSPRYGFLTVFQGRKQINIKVEVAMLSKQ